MIAILSDVHGNLEALTAVLADASRQGVTAIYNLGDLVGYGPNPVECVEIAMSWDVNQQGNFDHAVVHPPDGFGQSAEQSLTWSREVLRKFSTADALAWLAGITPKAQLEDMLLVHGSAHKPLHEYVFPEDIWNERKMARIQIAIDQYCFCGHTHWAGVFAWGGKWEYAEPREHGYLWRLDERKTIVNVGSVGQPRDGDSRASYVLVRGRDVTFRRVEYDVESTIRKIYAVPELADFLGDRLREGR